MKKPIDYSLYLVADQSFASFRSLEETVAGAVRGGVTVVQLRAKGCAETDVLNLAQTLQKILVPAGIPLIINDFVDVAMEAKADGVHIGQSDMHYENARRLLGPDAIIGLSVETLEQAMAAPEDVDYLGVSPVFLTPTKSELTTAWGLNGLRELRSRTQHRLVAIGGINISNAAAVISAGADGVAVVSAICSADDPAEAAAELKKAVDKSKSAGDGR